MRASTVVYVTNNCKLIFLHNLRTVHAYRQLKTEIPCTLIITHILVLENWLYSYCSVHLSLYYLMLSVLPLCASCFQGMLNTHAHAAIHIHIL